MDEESDIDHQDDSEMNSPDIDDDYTNYDFNREQRDWMSSLSSSNNQTADYMQRMTNEFAQTFAERYPSSKLQFCTTSLDEAITKSSLHPEFPRPLVLYIRHGQSISDNIFCGNCLCDDKVADSLNNQFLIWPWDRTDMERYRLLIKLLIEHFGNEITAKLISFPSSTDQYPLLVFLAKKENQCRVLSIINGYDQHADTLCTALTTIRSDFDELGPETSEGPSTIWCMPNSQLTPILRSNDHFQQIATRLDLEQQKITNIIKIENIMWSVQYSMAQTSLHDSQGATPAEKELFYGCPIALAQNILRHGFSLLSHCIHGESDDEGFYFSSERNLCEQYQDFKTSDGQSKAILICRILIFHATQSKDSKIFVVYRNEYIHPEYLVVYNP